MSKRTGQPNGPIMRWKSQRQAERRGIAELRNLRYSRLSISERIERLDAGGYVAAKQRAKLQKLLETVDKK